MSGPQLQKLTFGKIDASIKRVGLVSFFAGDETQQGQWLAGQVQCDTPTMRSAALQQIAVLRKLNELVDLEIGRLKGLYREAEQAQY